MNFTQHNQSIRVPRLISEVPLRVPTGRPELDALADRMVQRELEMANAEVDHRMTPEALEDYSHCLERVQRKLGVRPFNPPAGETF